MYWGKPPVWQEYPVKDKVTIISLWTNDPITMEQALEFGKQWLSEFTPHQAVVAVHPDGHNGSQNMHILWSSILSENMSESRTMA